MENIQIQHPKFVRWALLLGIVVILNIFFSVILSLAYPAPEYDTYCPTVNMSPTDPKTCEANNGVWTSYISDPNYREVSSPKADGYCDMYAKCQKPYDTAFDQHALRAFVLMTILGVLSLIIGLLPIGSSIVSSGFSYGGVMALIIGSMEYWGNAGNWIRLAIVTVGLLVLLYIGLKRFRD